MTHTPGPWAVKFRKDHSAYISMGDPLNGPHKQFDIEFSDLDPSDVADASLMESAPELLQALEELLAVAPAKAPAAGLLVGIEDRHAKAIKAAREAVKKARGEA